MKYALTFAAAVLPLVATATPALVNGCTPLGCFTDSVSARVLDINSQVANGPNDQSPEACTAACIALGLAYAGVEYGFECWCGAFIDHGQSLASDPSICDYPCTGAPSETCGGSDAINIYDCTAAIPPPLIYNGCLPLGCYTDSVSARTLATNTQVQGGPGNQSPEVCTAACLAAGFRYAGTEYSSECWCGNAIENSGGPAPDLNQQCQMPCNGDRSIMCGGPDRLDLYDCGYTCSNPGTCKTYVIIEDPSCGPYNECSCGFDADGRAVCIEGGDCTAVCNTNSDCGAGMVCVADSCCGFNACATPSTICANPASARAMFRGKAKGKAKRDCTTFHC
ncbi:hypothetical protein VF21_10396 [Pseudogymnoascus sp. 05NY08]|nr:hypothetical protein VF21_10396 [Pseudogymnoascus sp. 05NY08]